VCARYTLHHNVADLMKRFNVTETLVAEDVRPNYNVAPTHIQPIVHQTDCNGAALPRTLEQMNWGLLPPWWDKQPLVNVKMETIRDKPSFKGDFKRRRCIVPADGFFEWITEDGKKQPFHIRLKGGAVYGFAGLWHIGKDEKVRYSIITVPPNPLMEGIHDRMPAILCPDEEADWLTTPPEHALELLSVLKPYPHDDLEAVRVTPQMNKVGFNAPECIAPLVADSDLFSAG
jgi:putative SOS response-associated peptidase YedK